MKMKKAINKNTDWKVFALQKEKINERRNKRDDRFVNEWLPKFKEVCEVTWEPLLYRYILQSPTIGKIEFYPKGNRLFIHSTKKWKSDALVWLTQHFKLTT